MSDTANYLKPRYLTPDEVRPYLRGKVTFAKDLNQGLTDELFGELIAFGESELERDFSPYFKLPLQTKEGQPWTKLPLDTIALIKKCLLNRACFHTLQNSFGSNTNTRGEGFEKKLDVEYGLLKGGLFQQKPNGVFLFPPARGLALADSGINYNNVLPGAKNVPLGGQPSSALNYARNRLNNTARSIRYFFSR